MPHSLTVLNKSKYLHITVTGENTAENVKNYMSEVRSKCRELQCPNVLIEENLNGPGLGTLTMFKLVSEGVQNTRRVLQRIAYVDVNPEHRIESMQFAETVAVNRGVNIRVCSTVAEAEKWLEEQE